MVVSLKVVVKSPLIGTLALLEVTVFLNVVVSAPFSWIVEADETVVFWNVVVSCGVHAGRDPRGCCSDAARRSGRG
jgi:hypothetical protein